MNQKKTSIFQFTALREAQNPGTAFFLPGQTQ